MKKSREMIDLPVISITDGVQIGSVKGLAINPQQKTVEVLLLDEKTSGEGLKGIPFRSAEAIGEFAVTVEDNSVPISLEKVGILQELIEKGIDVIGTKVITKKGKYLGDVTEYSFEAATGMLKEFYYQSEGQVEKIVTVKNVITIGKEILVVEEDAISEMQDGEKASGLEKKADTFAPVTEVLPQEESKPPGDPVDAKAPFVPEEKGDLDPAGTFVQRQRQHIIGKTLLKDIKTDDGKVIALENTVVTEELFERIYKMGAQKLMELAVSVRE